MGSAPHAADGLQPKAVYEPVAKLEAFYTGGAVSVTRDNRHLACACGDEVKVLDLASGTVTRTLPGDSEPITSLALSPDKHTLVAASRSLTLRHWDWTSGECRRTWKPHRAPVADLAIDASGGFVASGSADRSIKVTDLAGGFVTHHFTGHSGIVLRVLFHARQLMLFSSCDAGEVRVWDLVTKAPAFKSMAKGHMSAVPALCLAPDGWHLLSGGRDKVVCVWDIRDGSRVATLPVYEALEGLTVLPVGSAFPGVEPVTSLVQQGSAKTHFFATAGERGVVRIWRSDTGACVYTYSGSSSSMLAQRGSSGGSSGSRRKKQKTALGASEVVAAAAGSELLELLLLPGGKGLLAATGDARLLFFNPQEEGGAAELALTRQLVGNLDEVTDLAFLYNSSSSGTDGSTDSSTAAASGDQQPTAAAAAAEGRLVLQPHEPRRVAVATNSQDIRLFELSDASCVGACVGHRDIVLSLAALKAAAGVELLASGAKDNEVRVWDTTSGTCLAVAAGHVAAVTALVWSRSKSGAGRYLASGGADKLLKLWDTSALLAAQGSKTGGAPLALSTVAAVAAHDKDVNALAFSPNDALLASAGADKVIKLWRLPSLVLTATLRGHKRGVWDLAFSPSEQVLVSCSGDKLLKLWSVVDGSCLRTFEGHIGGVLRVAFLTAGTQVLSSGADGLLKLWDTRTAANLATFESHEDRLWGLAVSQSPAESLVASGGADASIVVWRDVTEAKAVAAEAEEEALVLRQQELSNALADGDYAAAARLAFTLRHPGRLLEVLRRQPGGPSAALDALQGLVGGLQPDDLATALGYCREWNTNTRNAHLAQVLLRAILSRHTPEQILAVPGSAELIGGLLSYSQRHAARLDRLLRSTFLLDYTLAASQVLLPADAHDAAAAAAGDAAGLDGTLPMGNGLAQQQQQQQQLGRMKMLSADADVPDSIGAEDTLDGAAEAVAGRAAPRQAQSKHSRQQRASKTAAAAAAAAGGTGDEAALQPDPLLPGWGGGDDLSDDWEGPGEEVEDDAHDIMGSGDDDVISTDDDSMGRQDEDGGDSSGGGSSSDGDENIANGVSSESGEEASDDQGSAGFSESDDAGPSGSAEDDSEEPPQQQQQQQQQRQRAGRAAAKQQKQQELPLLGTKQQRRRQQQQQQRDVLPVVHTQQTANAVPRQQRRQQQQQELQQQSPVKHKRKQRQQSGAANGAAAVAAVPPVGSRQKRTAAAVAAGRGSSGGGGRTGTPAARRKKAGAAG